MGGYWPGGIFPRGLMAGCYWPEGVIGRRGITLEPVELQAQLST